MFDPSKLDLDLHTENKKEKENTATNKNNENNQTADLFKYKKEEGYKKIENNSTEIEDKNIDILSRLDLQDDTTKEDNQNNEEEKVIKNNIETNTERLENTDKQELIIDEKNIENNSEIEKDILPEINTIIKSEKNTKENLQEENVNQIIYSEQTKNKEENDNIIYDVNITKMEDILDLLALKEYDFVTLEPSENVVKITFRKDKVINDVKYIKYHLYANIVIKIKLLTRLKVEETDKVQEGSGEKIIKAKSYKVSSKIVPNEAGENIFIKIKKIEKQLSSKEKKKISLGQIMGLLGAGLFSVLIIGGAFLAFILLNSSNIGDLTFFNNLGVNVSSIKEFTSKLVDIVFFSILMIETGFLFTFIFKATLTKKEFKQKKIARIVISVFFLIITMLSGLLWLTLSQKITTLKGLNYGKIEYYDNSKYLNTLFDENGKKINLDDSLIGPVTIRFDISEFMKKLKDDNFKAKKLKWIIGKEEIKKGIESYEFIREFKKEGVHKVILEIEGININGEEETIKQELSDINIDTVVDIKKIKQKKGGNIYDFDASSLKNIGKVKWYYIPDVSDLDDEDKQIKEINKALSKETLMGYLFTTDIIFEEEVILGMKIITDGKEKDDLDKVFILSENEQNSIKGEIKFEKSIINDLKYTFYIENANTNLGDGILEEFEWKIEGKEIKNSADLNDLKGSSEIKHEFEKYGKHEIVVTLRDSRNQIEILSKTIDIPKTFKLSKNISIYNDGDLIKDIEYDKNLKEYYINEIQVPTKVELDARFVRLDSTIYSLNEVKWDYDSDGDFDHIGRKLEHPINTIGNHQIIVEYKFVNRNKKLKDDIIFVEEKIFFEGVNKEAILKFDIKKDSNYVPLKVSFDASRSIVTGKNISKFIWDYGDGVTEERDSVVKGHKYIKPGDYEIKLEIVTEDGKRYNTSKNLSLLAKPQSIKITKSMNSAPINQGIDFGSNESEGQISSYFWDFGDGNTSTEANPTHRYKKEGTYEIKLQLDFSNNNTLNESVEVEIYKDLKKN